MLHYYSFYISVFPGIIYVDEIVKYWDLGKSICNIQWFLSCVLIILTLSLLLWILIFIMFFPKCYILYCLPLTFYSYVGIIFEEFIYMEAKVYLSQILLLSIHIFTCMKHVCYMQIYKLNLKKMVTSCSLFSSTRMSRNGINT